MEMTGFLASILACHELRSLVEGVGWTVADLLDVDDVQVPFEDFLGTCRMPGDHQGLDSTQLTFFYKDKERRQNYSVIEIIADRT